MVKIFLSLLLLLAGAANADDQSRERQAPACDEATAALAPGHPLEQLFRAADTGGREEWLRFYRELGSDVSALLRQYRPAITAGELEMITHEITLAVTHEFVLHAPASPFSFARVAELCRLYSVGELRGQRPHTERELRWPEELKGRLPLLAPEYREALRMWIDGATVDMIAEATGRTRLETGRLIARVEPLLDQASEDISAGLRDEYLARVGRVNERTRAMMHLWHLGHSWAEISRRVNVPAPDVRNLVLDADRGIRNEMMRPSQRNPQLYRRAIERLTGRDRDVMHLHLEGLTARAISARLGFSEDVAAHLVGQWNGRIETALRDLQGPLPEDQVEAFLTRALLPSGQRRALLLHEAGKTIEEIARTMNTTVRTAGMMLTNAQSVVRSATAPPPPVGAPSMVALFNRAIPFLPERERRIMELRMRGLNVPQITERTGLTRGIVSTAIQRTEARFRDAFGQWGTGPGTPALERRALALAQFAETQRRILEMHFDGRTTEQISAALGFPARTVNSFRTQGLTRLEEILSAGPQ